MTQPIRISDVVAQPHLQHFNSMLPNQLDHGGRAGYKSSKNAIKIALLMLNNPTIEVVVFRQDYSDHKDSTFRDLIWAFETLGVPLKVHANYPNGNDLWIKLPQGNYVHFKQMKVKDKLKGIRPTIPTNTISIAWFFEITEYKDRSYISSAQSGVMRAAGDWFLSLYEWNDAPKLSDWTYEFLDEMNDREDAYVKKTNYNDTPVEQQEQFLGKPLLKEIEILKRTNIELYKSEYMGLPANLKGSCYKTFNRADNVGAITNDYIDILIGVDYGGNDATVATAIGIKPNFGGIDVIDTYYHMNGKTEGTKNINQYCEEIMEFVQSVYIRYKINITLFLDSANNTTMGMLLEDETLTPNYHYVVMGYLNKLKKRRGTNKKKSAIQERIDMLEIMFGSKFITIAPTNKQLIKAIESAEYDKNGDRLDNGTSDIDSLDSLEYSWLMEMDFIHDTIMMK